MIGSEQDPSQKAHYLAKLKDSIQAFVSAFPSPNFEVAAEDLINTVSLEIEFPTDMLKLDAFQKVCIEGLSNNDYVKPVSLVLTRISFKIASFERRFHNVLMETIINSLKSNIISLENTQFLFKLLANLTSTMSEAEIDNIIQDISIPIFKAIRRRNVYKADLILIRNISQNMISTDDYYNPKYKPGQNPFYNYLLYLTKTIRKDPTSEAAQIAAWIIADWSHRRGTTFSQDLVKINFFKYANSIIRPQLVISGPLLYILTTSVLYTYESKQSDNSIKPYSLINYAAVLNCLNSTDTDTVYYALLLIQVTAKRRFQNLKTIGNIEEAINSIPPFERAEVDEEEEVFEEEIFEEIAPEVPIPEPETQIDIYGSLLSFIEEDRPYRLHQEAICTLAFLVQCETASFSDQIPLEPCVKALIDGISDGGSESTAVLVVRALCFLRDTMVLLGRQEECEDLFASNNVPEVLEEYQCTELEELRMALDIFDHVEESNSLAAVARDRAMIQEQLRVIRQQFGIVDDDFVIKLRFVH